ncbi:MAG: MotA/TolQ/ExbB proton channel family protein [Kiritimatiellia bacterium]
MLNMINAGGPMIWVILAAGILAVWIFVERLFHLHRAQIKTDDFLKGIYNILNRGNIVEAVSICEDTPGPVADVVRAAILNYDTPVSEMEKAVQEAGLLEIPRLERNIITLGTVAQIAPLLGLLGTILGLMQNLLVMQQQSPLVQPGDLAGGLWQALISTAAGLTLAIPAHAAYNLLMGRVESILLDMEKASVDIISFLSKRSAGVKS